MKPSELERLIQDVLDGVATPEERARLDATLERQPEAKTRYREMEGLFATLGHVPTVEAPEDLQRDVMQRIEERGRKPVVRTRLQSWTGQLAQRPALALGVPFAFGFVAGAMVLAAWMAGLGPGPDGRRDVSGTMMPPSEARSARWPLGPGQLSAQTWRSGRKVFLRLQVRGDSPVGVDLGYGQGRNLTQVRQTPPSNGRLSMTAGRVSWEPGRTGEIQLEWLETVASPEPLRALVRSAEGEREVIVPLAPPAEETR